MDQGVLGHLPQCLGGRWSLELVLERERVCCGPNENSQENGSEGCSGQWPWPPWRGASQLAEDHCRTQHRTCGWQRTWCLRTNPWICVFAATWDHDLWVQNPWITWLLPAFSLPQGSDLLSGIWKHWVCQPECLSPLALLCQGRTHHSVCSPTLWCI
jgi:hypothetical protein